MTHPYNQPNKSHLTYYLLIFCLISILCGGNTLTVVAQPAIGTSTFGSNVGIIAASGASPRSATLDGYAFTIHSAVNCAISNASGNVNLISTPVTTGIWQYATIASSDGSEFQLDNFNFRVLTAPFVGLTITVTGYKDGALVSGASFTTAAISGTGTTILVNVSSDADFDNIDEFRLTPSGSTAQGTLAIEDITISAAVVPTPTIVTGGTLSAFAACTGTASAAQNFTTSGTNLTANLVVTAPSNLEVSTTAGSGYASSVSLVPSSGTVNTTTIYVRVASTAPAGALGSNNVTNTSTGATTQNVATSGTVTTSVTPSVALSPTLVLPGSQTFTASASNIGGGTVTYTFKKNTISQQSGASTTWNATGLVASDVIVCDISVAGGTCLTSSTATSNSVTISSNPSVVRGNMLVVASPNEVNAGNVAVMNFERTNTFSLEAWIQTSDADGGIIISKALTDATAQGYILELLASGAVSFRLNANAGTSNTIRIATSSTYNDGLWHHIVGTYDGTNAATGLKIFVDGIQAALNGGLTLNSLSTNIANTGDVRIGPGLTGNIEEARIWSTTRTQSQIRENMHLTLTGLETGLIAYYQFNEASGNAIDNINGNNGTLSGATRTTSTISVATGVSTRQTVSSTGTVAFGNLTVNFNSVTGSDEFVAYQLYDTPYNNLNSTNTTSNYWIVRQFGSASFSYDQMIFTIPSSNVVSTTDEATPANLKLYKRTTNSAGSWGTAIGTGTAASNTTKVITYSISPAQTSFSELIPGSDFSPLPVTLLHFNAIRISSEQVALTWQTTSETQNTGFEVEASTDSRTFEKIGFVAGTGTSKTLRTYQFTATSAQKTYYRLKQIDFDGTASYSLVRVVEESATNSSLTLFPTPTTNHLTISLLTKDSSSLVSVRIVTTQGVEVFQTQGSLSGINKLLNENLPIWKSGLYILHARTKTQVWAKPFMVIK